MTQVQSSSGGTVVAFRSTGHKTRRPASQGEGRGAILLFTGVRYDRMDAEPSQSAAPPRPESDKPGAA